MRRLPLEPLLPLQLVRRVSVLMRAVLRSGFGGGLSRLEKRLCRVSSCFPMKILVLNLFNEKLTTTMNHLNTGGLEGTGQDTRRPSSVVSLLLNPDLRETTKEVGSVNKMYVLYIFFYIVKAALCMTR